MQHKNTLQSCPRFQTLAPPWGMKPCVHSYGILENPIRHECSKYECFLTNEQLDMSIQKNFNAA